MPLASPLSAKPSLFCRVLVLVGVPLLLAVCFVGSPFAQSAHQGHGPGGYGPGSGPPSPATLRDSLRTSMQLMRSAFESGDRSAARERRQAVERQWKDLSDRDKNFDKGLRDILTKDQQQRYQRWKPDRQNEQRDRWLGRRSAQDREGWSSRSQPR